MKKILSSKSALLGLSCAGVLMVLPSVNATQMPATLGNLPLFFESNQGRTDDPASFVVRGLDYQFLISAAGARMELQKKDALTQETSLRTVRMQFVGASSQAQICGADDLPGKVNYLVGNSPAQWRTGVALFSRVRVGQLYPGINLVYYGNQQQLEYDFTIAPGASSDAIKLRFDGVDNISTGAQGELILALGRSEILQRAPMIYQIVDGARKRIGGGYRLLDRHTVTFTIGKYDHHLPLVIDPILSYSTYFGGNSSDAAWSIALDTNGFVYIAGQTLSGQFYPTPGAFQTNFAGGGITGDAFVAKFDNQASNLVYMTYLGGAADDSAASIALDNAGNAFVTGFTDSPNFPTTTNALYRNIGGSPTPGGYFLDAFVTELSPGGSNLVYSTYLGGSGPDSGSGIALDASNNIYVAGYTDSPDLPTTTNAFQKHLGCPYSIYTTYLYANAFLAEISASGTNLLYCSYFGGTNYDAGESIAVDNSNYVYMTGFTASTNFPNTNAFQPYLNGTTNSTTYYDAFVAEFTPSCTNLVYSTFLGGTNNDVAYHIAVDGSGNAYVTGWTVSTNFPDTVTNVPGLYNGLTNNTGVSYPYITNAFLTQVTWNGTHAAIGYSAVFGGTNFGIDIGYDVALDPSGNAFVVGASSSTNFPAVNTPGLLSATNAGGSDAFVIAFNTNCSAILYSGYLGGSGNDLGLSIAVDSVTNVYIAGQTASANFPAFSPYQSSLKGASDGFLAKIDWTVIPPEITTQPTNQETGVASTATLAVVATGTPPLTYQWQEQGTNLIWTNLVNGGNTSGATNATLNIFNAQTTNSGSYQVIVTNYGGSVTSSVAVLTVTNVATVITLQPASQTIAVGSTATFDSGGTAQQPLVLQWLKDGIDLTNGTTISGSIISGATSVPLTIRNAQTNDDGTYWLVISNAWGVLATSNAILTVVSFPTITVPPTNQTVGLGSLVTFTVTAVGTAPLNYQWQENGTNLVNGGRIGGATNFALTVTNAQVSDNGDYSVIVTNDLGSVTSSPPAILTVLTAPRFGSITAATNGGFVLSGVGGTNSGTYFVLSTTNLTTPLAQWTPVATNQFGGQGQFVFTNTPPTNTPQQFYLLQSP